MKFKKLYLTEKFSSSMPEWLKNYVLYNTRPETRLHTKALDRKNRDWDAPYRSHIYDDSPFANPEYRKLSGAQNREFGRDERNPAIKSLREVDFSRANFVTADEVPNLKDPTLQDPNKQWFIHLKSDRDETIWSPGHSSEFERFTLDDGRDITMKMLNNKLLRLYGKDACYVDISDQSNLKEPLHQARVNNREGSEQRFQSWQVDRYNAEKSWRQPKADKSGYLKIPAAKKYADKLAKLRYNKLSNLIETTRDGLIKLQQDINRVNSIMINGISDKSTRYDNYNNYVDDAYNNLKNAVYQYQYGIDLVDQLDETNMDKSDFNNTIENINNRMTSSKLFIDKGAKRISHLLPKIIDWNEFDDSIYTDEEEDEFD